MIIQPTIPYHLMGISYTAMIEVVTTREEYAFILRTMYFHVAEMISNCLILSAFGLKSLFIIENSFLVHFTDLRILLPKLCHLSKIGLASIGLAFDSNINDVFIKGDFNFDTLKIPLTKTFLLFVNNSV